SSPPQATAPSTSARAASARRSLNDFPLTSSPFLPISPPVRRRRPTLYRPLLRYSSGLDALNEERIGGADRKTMHERRRRAKAGRWARLHRAFRVAGATPRRTADRGAPPGARGPGPRAGGRARASGRA